jgi:hypothetical protein
VLTAVPQGNPLREHRTKQDLGGRLTVLHGEVHHDGEGRLFGLGLHHTLL